jgi:hypothetical protein
LGCDGAQLLRTDRGPGKDECHRRGQILYIDGRATVIEEGVTQPRATVDPSGILTAWPSSVLSGYISSTYGNRPGASRGSSWT